jgi:hypothetical protein
VAVEYRKWGEGAHGSTLSIEERAMEVVWDVNLKG